jgi:hypothetical protein
VIGAGVVGLVGLGVDVNRHGVVGATVVNHSRWSGRGCCDWRWSGRGCSDWRLELEA